MNVSDIIYQVRESLDEQSGTTDYADGYMDNIIKAKINDALRWVNLYADVSLLRSSTGDGSECVAEVTGTGNVTLPGCVRILRIKGSTWSRAVLNPYKEDSEEYMMQNDDNYPEAKATKERPVAVVVEGRETKVIGFPSDSLTVDYVKAVSVDVSDSTTSVGVPDSVRSAFIYYLAYLVMIAYDDTSKAANMLATAKMCAGVVEGKG